MVSHAGVGMLREIGDLTGLTSQVSAVLADTYKGQWVHDPGPGVHRSRGGGRRWRGLCVRDRVLVDQQAQHGPVASVTTAWRLIDARVDAAHLAGVKTARSAARAAAWAAGAAPAEGTELVLDADATITIDHSDAKENAAATWKRTFGFHPLLVFLDRPDIAAGEALAGLLRAGNAGSNTAADHITVLEMALAALPEAASPRPGDPSGPRLLARSDSAGATHAFAAACRQRGVGSPSGSRSTTRIQRIVDAIPDSCWHPALDTDDDLREGPGWPRPPG